MTINNFAQESAEIIKNNFPQYRPIIGVVCGSGLGSFADQLEEKVLISYDDLPGFPKVTVSGHSGNLVLGRLGEIDIMCLEGRSHSYENQDFTPVLTYVRTLKLAGCKYFIATNASGSLREDVGPGELMLITDHINMQPGNPLAGENDERFGPRFYPLDNAYDKDMREQLLNIAQEEQINLHQGVYISVLGPNYETAAEIRAFRILGADAVGMSTVPEVLVANHCGLKVAVIATVTNYATGLSTVSHSHEAVVRMASTASNRLNRLLTTYISRLKSNN